MPCCVCASKRRCRCAWRRGSGWRVRLWRPRGAANDTGARHMAVGGRRPRRCARTRGCQRSAALRQADATAAAAAAAPAAVGAHRRRGGRKTAEGVDGGGGCCGVVGLLRGCRRHEMGLPGHVRSACEPRLLFTCYDLGNGAMTPRQSTVPAVRHVGVWRCSASQGGGRADALAHPVPRVAYQLPRGTAVAAMRPSHAVVPVTRGARLKTEAFVPFPGHHFFSRPFPRAQLSKQNIHHPQTISQ